MNWTKKDIENILKDVKYVLIPQDTKKGVKIPKSIGKYKLHIRSVLEKSGLEFKTEVRVSPKRLFRFDWACKEKMIAVEFEGIISEKSGHTTIGGYSKDCIKYNLAQCLGWKVLRYTVVNYMDIEDDLKKLIQ